MDAAVFAMVMAFLAILVVVGIVAGLIALIAKFAYIIIPTCIITSIVNAFSKNKRRSKRK